MSLPWPAEHFLNDASVRLALSRERHSDVAFLILFASASWIEDSGVLPDDTERLAASLNLRREVVASALEFWKAEGKIVCEGDTLYLPWLTRAKATASAGAKARSEQAKGAAETRWAAPDPGENLALMPAASEQHADSKEWPKDYTTRACDIWIARWGSGSAPGDVIGSCLRQMKKGGADWGAVIRSFQRYVDVVDEKYASPQAWRKRWKSYDPEEPEHDHEIAEIVHSYDRQDRQRRKRGGLKQVTE